MLRIARKALWVLLPLVLLVKPVQAEEAVAMVTDLSGEATLSDAGSREQLQVLDYLSPGAQIDVHKGGRVVVTFFAGSAELTLTGPASAKVGPDGLQVLSGAPAVAHKLAQDDAVAVRKFSAMQREKLAQATFEMRGARPGLRLIGPIDTRVSSLTPEFEWSAPHEAKTFSFRLMESGKTLRDLETRKSRWRVAAPSLLKYGHAYVWKVQTHLASGEILSASGSFSILGKDKAKAIAAARPPAGADFSARLLYAMKLETLGLKYEARRAWKTLAIERPNAPALHEQAVQ